MSKEIRTDVWMAMNRHLNRQQQNQPTQVVTQKKQSPGHKKLAQSRARQQRLAADDLPPQVTPLDDPNQPIYNSLMGPAPKAKSGPVEPLLPPTGPPAGFTSQQATAKNLQAARARKGGSGLETTGQRVAPLPTGDQNK